MKNSSQNFITTQKTVLTILVAMTIVIFLFTYFSIKESRSDSLKLLVIQGEAFIESLSSAAKNAISSEEFYTQLAHKRYNEITLELEQLELSSITNEKLFRLCLLHNLYSAHVFDLNANLVAGSFARGSQIKLPQFVIDEVKYLISNPEENYLLLLDDENNAGETRHYYIKMSNKLDRITVLVTDALYFTDALEQTQIGYLARQMTSNSSIKYIIYQSTDGIIFSSYEIDGILSIDSDEFLTNALESDTIMHRIYPINGEELLEIVRPFSTSDYPFGLLRIGLSLDDYKSISRRYDWQMIIFSTGLLLLLIISIRYLSSRKKRRIILEEYDQFRSISDKIFNEMNTGVAAIDKEGKFIVVNRAFENIVEIQNLSGTGWDKIATELLPSLPKIQRTSPRVIEQELNYRVNEKEKILLIVLSSLSSKDSDNEGFVVVINDITTLRELEQKTARKERLSEMGDLAAGVAHEIRNPLNTISIASQRLASEFAPSENQDEYLSFTKQIKDETKRLNDIITKFLALARGDVKQKSEIDISQIVSEFVRFICVEAESLTIQSQVDISPECKIQGDADTVKQLLANLYNNTKEAFEGKAGILKISVQKDSSLVHVTFEDNGPGIPEQIREKVFTPYYTTKEAGTGLGLPTIHRIVLDMGGEIKVGESKLGGAKFHITFPILK